MAQFLAVFFQAVGILFFVWSIIGWILLRGERGGLCVFFCEPGNITRAQRFGETCLWFRETGLTNMRVLLVNGGLTPEEEQVLLRFSGAREHICLCSQSEVLEILEREAKLHGRSRTVAGNGSGSYLSKP